VTGVYVSTQLADVFVISVSIANNTLLAEQITRTANIIELEQVRRNSINFWICVSQQFDFTRHGQLIKILWAWPYDPVATGDGKFIFIFP